MKCNSMLAIRVHILALPRWCKSNCSWSELASPVGGGLGWGATSQLLRLRESARVKTLLCGRSFPLLVTSSLQDDFSLDDCRMVAEDVYTSRPFVWWWCTGKQWIALLSSLSINTLRPRQNGRHFPGDIFKCILLNEDAWISIKNSLKFVPKGSINNIPTLVQIMACAGQVTSHYLNQWWLVYWCIYASLGLNEYFNKAFSVVI